MEGLVNSIFEPGVNRSLLIATNVAFGTLMAVLLLIGFFVELNIHIVFITILTFLLWMAINWFIVESGASCTPVKSTDPDTGGDGAEKDSDATVQLDAGNSQHQKAE